MPKVTLDPWGDKARMILSEGAVRGQLRPSVTAKKLGISEPSWYRRFRTPGEIRLTELKQLVRNMKLTDEEILTLVRG